MLENIAEEIKGGAKVLGLGAALLFGSAAFAHAQEIDHNKRYFFECNYWEDTQKDNSIDSWDQYHGIKQSFKNNEEIIFVGHDPRWTNGVKLQWTLYGPNGGVVESDTHTLQYDGEWYHAGEGDDEDLMLDMILSENGGNGLYKVEWKYTIDQEEDTVDTSFVVSSSK
jgi:hypothetical protein